MLSIFITTYNYLLKNKLGVSKYWGWLVKIRLAFVIIGFYLSVL